MEILKTGSQGALVQLLQVGLARAGFDPGAPDGKFGPATRRALEEFQTAQGLAADGVAGPLTWQALEPWLLGYFVSTVQAGDTFSSIAQRYQTSIQAIATANPGADPLNLQIGSRLVVPLGFPLVPTNIAFSSSLMDYLARGLKARYPFLGVGSAGRSIMGHPLTFFTIGRGPVQIFYNASHHANEWITTPILMKFLEEYAQAWAAGKKLGDMPADTLYTGATLFLIPLVNPDGVDLVTGALPPGSYYYRQAQTLARNYPEIPFPSGWKANINGVDLNLSYPAGWQNAREIKFQQGFTSPGPRDYVGNTPLSQPEALAVYTFTRSHDFALTLSYHAQGEIIYWRYLDYLPPRSREIALEMGEASGYSVEETPAASGYAGYKDWYILAYDRPGYTIEVGKGISPLPLDQLDKIYRDNLGILLIGITSMLDLASPLPQQGDSSSGEEAFQEPGAEQDSKAPTMQPAASPGRSTPICNHSRIIGGKPFWMTPCPPLDTLPRFLAREKIR